MAKSKPYQKNKPVTAGLTYTHLGRDWIAQKNQSKAKVAPGNNTFWKPAPEPTKPEPIKPVVPPTPEPEKTVTETVANELREKIAAAEAANATLKGEIGGLTKKLEAATAESVQANANLAAMRVRYEAQEKEIVALKQQVKDLTPVPAPAPTPPAPAPVPPPAPVTPTPTKSDVKVVGGSVEITEEGVYDNFERRGKQTDTAVVKIRTSKRVVLKNNLFSGPTLMIARVSVGVNLRVENSRFAHTAPEKDGIGSGRIFHCSGAKNVEALNCESTGGQGWLFQNFAGNGADYGIGDPRNQTVRIMYNKARNLNGSWRNPAAATSHRKFFSNFIQFLDSRVPNAEIAWNEVINEDGLCSTEDILNWFNSGGLPGQEAKVHNNLFWGTWRAHQYRDDDEYSAAIIQHDGDPNNLDPAKETSFVKYWDNHPLAGNNCGFSIAYGHNITSERGESINSGFNHKGEFRGKGFSAAAIFNKANKPASIFYNNSIKGMLVGCRRDGENNPYQNRNDISKTSRSNDYLGWITGTKPLPNRPLTYKDEVDSYNRWLGKVKVQGLKIGLLT